jgi:hypothetical protein
LEERTLRSDFYEMELVGTDFMLVGVPLDTPAELKKRIVGATVSYHMNLNSIDYTIRRYLDAWEPRAIPAEEQRLLATLRAISEKVDALVSAMLDSKPHEGTPGVVAAEAALLRLKTTFAAALFLIAQAKAFEAAAMVRLVLEQCAWAFAVRAHASEVAVRNTSPTGAVSALRNIAPFAGRLYGILSEQAHLDPESAGRSYVARNEAGAVEVYLRHTRSTQTILGYLLVALGLYRTIVLEVGGSYLSEKPEMGASERYRTTSERLSDALAELQALHEELRWLPNEPLHPDARQGAHP